MSRNTPSQPPKSGVGARQPAPNHRTGSGSRPGGAKYPIPTSAPASPKRIRGS